METGQPSSLGAHDTYSVWQQQQQRNDQSAAVSTTGVGAAPAAAPASDSRQAHGKRNNNSHLSLLKRLKHLLQCTVPASTTDLALHAQRLAQPPSTTQRQQQQEQGAYHNSNQAAAAAGPANLQVRQVSGRQPHSAAAVEAAASLGTPQAPGPHSTSSAPSCVAVTPLQPAGPAGAQRQLFVQAAAAAGIPVVAPSSWPTTGAAAGPTTPSMLATAPTVTAAVHTFSACSTRASVQPSSSVPAPVCRRSMVDLGAALAAARAAGSPSVLGAPMPLRRSSVIISPNSKRSVFRHRAHLRTSGPISSSSVLAPTQPAHSNQTMPSQQENEGAANIPSMSQQSDQASNLQGGRSSSPTSTKGAGRPAAGADVGSSCKETSGPSSSKARCCSSLSQPSGQPGDSYGLAAAAAGVAEQQQQQQQQQGEHHTCRPLQQQDIMPGGPAGQAGGTADTAAFLGKPRRLLQQAGASSTLNEVALQASSLSPGPVDHEQQEGPSPSSMPHSSAASLVPCAGMSSWGPAGAAGACAEVAQSAAGFSSAQPVPDCHTPVFMDGQAAAGAAAGGGTTPQLTCWGSGAVSSEGWPTSRAGSRSVTPLAPASSKHASQAEQGVAQLLGPLLAAGGVRAISSSDAEEYASCSSLLEGVPAAAAASAAAAREVAVDAVEGSSRARVGTSQVMLPLHTELAVGLQPGSDGAVLWLAPWVTEGAPSADAAAASAAAATWEAMGGALAAYGQQPGTYREGATMDGSQAPQSQQAWQPTSTVLRPAAGAALSAHTTNNNSGADPFGSQQMGAVDGIGMAARSSQAGGDDSPGKVTQGGSPSKDTARHKDQHLVKLLRQLSINSIITADEQQVVVTPATASTSRSPVTPPGSPAAPNSSSFRRLGTSGVGLSGDTAAADAQLGLYYTGSSSSSEGYGAGDGEEDCDSGDTSLLEQWLLESHAGGDGPGTSSRVSSRAASMISSRSAAIQRSRGPGPSRLARSSLAGASRGSSLEAGAAAAAAYKVVEAPSCSMLAAPAGGLPAGSERMPCSSLPHMKDSQMQLQGAAGACGTHKVDLAAASPAAASNQGAASSNGEGVMANLLAQQLAAPGFAWPTPPSTAPPTAPQQAPGRLDELASLAFTDSAWPQEQLPAAVGGWAAGSSSRAAVQLSAVAAGGHLDSMPSMSFTDCAWPQASGTHSSANPLAASMPAAAALHAQLGGSQQQVAAALRRSAAAGAGNDVLSSLVGATLAQQLRWPDTSGLAAVPAASVSTAAGPGSDEPQYTEQGGSSDAAVVSLQGGFPVTSAGDSDVSLELGLHPQPLAAAGELGMDAAAFCAPRDSWLHSSFNPLYDTAALALTPPPTAVQGGGAAASSGAPAARAPLSAPAAAMAPSMQQPPVPRPPNATQGLPQGGVQIQPPGLLHHDPDQPQPRKTPPPSPLQQQQGGLSVGVPTAPGWVRPLAQHTGVATDPPKEAVVVPVRAAAAALQPGASAGLSASQQQQEQPGVPCLLQRLIDDLSCLNTLISKQGLQETESAQLKQVLMSGALQQLQGHLQVPTALTQATPLVNTAADAAPAGAAGMRPRDPKERAAAAVASKMIRNSIDLLTALTNGSNLVSAPTSSPQQRLAAAFSSSLYGVSSLPPPAAPVLLCGEDSAWQGPGCSPTIGMGGPAPPMDTPSHLAGAAAVGGVAPAADGSAGAGAGAAGCGLAPLTVRLHQAPYSSDGSNSTSALSAPLVVVQQGGQQVKLSHFRPSVEDVLQQRMDLVVQAQLRGGGSSSSAAGATPQDVLHGLKWAEKLAKQAGVARPGIAAPQAPTGAAAAATAPGLGGAWADTCSRAGKLPAAAAVTAARAAAAPAATTMSGAAAVRGEHSGVGAGAGGGVGANGSSPAVTPRAIPCSSPTPGIISAPLAPAAMHLEPEPMLTIRAPSMQLLGADADLASADVLLGSPMLRSQTSLLTMRPLTTPASLAPSSTALTGVAAATPTAATAAAASQSVGFGGSSSGSPAMGFQQQGYVTPGVTLPSLGGSPGALVCPGGPRPPSRAVSRRPPQLMSTTSPTLPPPAATATQEAGGPTSPFRCSKNLLPVFEAEVAAGAGWPQPQAAMQAMLPLASEQSIGTSAHVLQPPFSPVPASPSIVHAGSRALSSSSPQVARTRAAAHSSSHKSPSTGTAAAVRSSQAAAAAAELLKEQLVARLSGRDIGAMSLEELDQVYSVVRSLSSNLREPGDVDSPTLAAVL